MKFADFLNFFLKPYGDTLYQVDVELSPEELLAVLKDNTASGIFAAQSGKRFCGRLSSRDFHLRWIFSKLRNSWGPIASGRFVETGESCSSLGREQTRGYTRGYSRLEFRIVMSPAVQLLVPVVMLCLLLVMLVGFSEIFVDWRRAILIMLPLILMPSFVSLVAVLGVKLGQRDARQMLAYFESLPGATLKEAPKVKHFIT
ncbi:MAG: hypothetical protein J0M35_11830 [Candidatus Obscuribacter phosphatis]|uniref:Uncharacterized protein n=1 Tax=Candidatus Obscuribacter phosphatis TaxID=1906157 RepID=A0A8J7PGP7_9BACT|nr:hypothetical protein [Candidatus Obscuribacter phosphatis]